MRMIWSCFSSSSSSWRMRSAAAELATDADGALNAKELRGGLPLHEVRLGQVERKGARRVGFQTGQREPLRVARDGRSQVRPAPPLQLP